MGGGLLLLKCLGVKRLVPARQGAQEISPGMNGVGQPPAELALVVEKLHHLGKFPALRERGLLFVGIDVIDGNLTEINVTSPTGIRAIARLDGPDVAAKIWDVIEKKRTKV